MSAEELEPVSEEAILKRHKLESKQLQGNIQQLKKSINKDKKRKKEIHDEIASLEKNLLDRHAEELTQFKNSSAVKTEISPEEVESLHISTSNENDLNSNHTEELSDEETCPIQSNKKVSRAEKKRQKKLLESKEREQRIKEAEKLNRFCARNVEADKIKKILKQRGLQMHEINPDGNCLYAAVAHQLSTGNTIGDLRMKTSNYLRANVDDFLPFITDPSTGDLLTPAQFEEYCHQLQTTSTWGGQPELRALSIVLKKRIEVLQAEGSPIVFGEDFATTDGVLLAYYRHYYGLGEHYNSVKPLLAAEEEEEEG